MTFISYAQNYEDVLLWRALKDIDKGRYIDVGACDPILESVSKAFYENGWRGVHVEPETRYVELLRRDRPDERIVQAVVSSQPQSQTFYEVAVRGWSTASKDLAETYRLRGKEIVEKHIHSVTLDEVLAEVDSEEVHWLKIDVEGLEFDVLKSWSRTSRRPWIVLIEAIDPLTQKENHEEWEPLLLAKGYVFVYFDGLNRFYVSTEHKELIPSFRYGPSLWDGFRLFRQENEIEQIRKEAQSAFVQVSASLTRARAEIAVITEVLCGAQAALRQAQAELGRTKGTLQETQEVSDNLQSTLTRARAELDENRTESDRFADEPAQTKALLKQMRADFGSVRAKVNNTGDETKQTHRKKSEVATRTPDTTHRKDSKRTTKRKKALQPR